MRRSRPTLTIHVIRRARYVRGIVVERHDVPTGHALPHVIARRASVAHAVGLTFVRALGDGGDVFHVDVSDGRRVLASWRRMDAPGFTGTHDVHPLTSATMGRETFGAYLARRASRVED